MTIHHAIHSIITAGSLLLSTTAFAAAEPTHSTMPASTSSRPSVSVAGATPDSAPAGIFHRAGDGTYVYQSDAYRATFNQAGQICSLRVKGQEFLRPDANAARSGDGVPGAGAASGGAAFYSDGQRVVQDSFQIAADGGLIADGVHGTFLHFWPDRIDMDLGNDNTAGLDQYVFFPANGVKMAPVENPVFHGSRTETWQIVGKGATRFTAPNGTSIEIHYDAGPTADFQGHPALPVTIPFKTRICGEISFPASNWATDTAIINLEAKREDHNFAAGEPLDFGGTVELRSKETQERALELLVQIEDINLATVAWEARRTLKITPGKPANFHESLPWTRTGPWRVRVFALNGSEAGGEHAIGFKSGVVVYDLPNYKPALERPADFWKFWEDAIAQQRKLPLAPMRTKNDAASTDKYTVYDVFITGYMGRRLPGKWIEPTAPGQFPVSIGAVHPGAAVVPPIEDGVCCLQYSLDGSATYRTGMGDRYTSNLFYNYMDTLRWVDFAANSHKADINRSIYFAGSRSGPPGIAAMALDPRLKMYIANVPTNNRWDWQVSLPGAGGWGPWAADRPTGQSLADFEKQLSYFNSDNFAERITQPVLIGFGLLDGFSQVTGNLSCFARIPSQQKKICFRPWFGHSDPNQDWKDTSELWRKQLFHPAP